MPSRLSRRQSLRAAGRMGYLDLDRHGSFLSAEADFPRRFLGKVDPMTAERGASIDEFHVRALTGSEAGHFDVRSKRKPVRRRGVVALMALPGLGSFRSGVRSSGALTTPSRRARPTRSRKPGATWPWIELAAVPRLKRLLESVSTIAAPQGLKLPETIRHYPKD